MTGGIILKGIGGFYYVKTDREIIECRARGVFRNEDIKPLPGDLVEVEKLSDGTGSVVSVLPRKNSFIRPPIANIDCLVIVVAVKNPKPDLKFIDKILVIAEASNIEAVICLNKCDLCDDYDSIRKLYETIGYKVVTTSTKNGTGICELSEQIKGKTTAFVGFSGVGKSSILNEFFPELKLQTGDISKKLNRGRHTTRHIELFEYDGGYIADTPGFSMLEIPKLEPEQLQDCFPEFKAFSDKCKFSGCMHLGGKQCGVVGAVEENVIAESRYNNYVEFYNFLKNSKECYPK